MTPRILLTGGTGRIGRHVHAEFVSEGFEVHSLGSASRGRPSGVDLESRSEVDRVVDEIHPEVVVHFGGRVPGHGDDFDINAISTALLLEASERAAVSRFVLASSAAVYGDQRTEPLSETAPPSAQSSYALSKLRAEETAIASPVSTVVLRMFNVFGPGLDDSLVARLRRSTPAAPASLRGLDTFVRDYVDVSDVARAATAAATAPMPEAHVVLNIGSGIPRSNRDLVQELSRRRPVYFEDVGGPPSHSVADITRARAILGYRPTEAIGDVHDV